MRAVVFATSLVLGACGRRDVPAGDAATPARATPDASARDARPHTEVTQATDARSAPGRPAPIAARPTSLLDTSTLARPDGVPGSGATRVPDAAADRAPQMRNARLPFHYPGALYARRVQGNVTLRLWVDSTGHVRPESTRVAESSGSGLLDSAAVAGSRRLEFTPARHAGYAIGAPLLFPVHFRHPAARSPAGGAPANAAPAAPRTGRSTGRRR